MKRYALLVVMAMGCMVCAQPAHRDTVHYGDPWYAFNTLPSLDTIDYFEYFIPPHQTATCNYWGVFHPYPIAHILPTRGQEKILPPFSYTKKTLFVFLLIL